ncbi:CinA family protein [Parabacteroides goldsteinii]|uniref:Competence/damage-inducible protein CinA domain protein n=2 Tax=Parabacteroides goldsteinii TaxID=328812 RepID=K5YR66_9BACT|nr:CinA family protein [Parabacteroides goldsteinii]EKN16582.1 competence/damage-inducible protein CinA domain protein [Parabacteroides goldsteinii CL02T12C30]KMM31812.1 competence protein [Parabacteroides goldsteinii]
MNNNNSLSEQLGGLLRSKGLLMGTAESCTGGRIANMVTLVAGSSDYFVGGVVSYSNEVKHNVLGVSEDSLRLHGAVSREVVEQMAQGAIRTLGCDCSVATSGVAGPDGGSPEKPVGTVWIAAALKEQVVSHCYHFGTVRAENIQSAADTALTMLLELLQKSDG